MIKAKRDPLAAIREIGDQVAKEAQSVTRDAKFEEGMNGLCQKLDRILSGDKELRVVSGTDNLAPAYTNLQATRSIVHLNHSWIEKWTKGYNVIRSQQQLDMRDRITLTLGMNLHELGHVQFSPRLKALTPYKQQQARFYNALEDQRQEMLMTLEYPKARDYFRLVNARALKDALDKLNKAGKPIPPQMFLLYYGRRHLFPSDVNVTLLRAFQAKYPNDAPKVKTLIKEFMTLDFSKSYSAAENRAWEIVEELWPFWSPDFPTKEEFEQFMKELEDLLRDIHRDCMPQQGQPTSSLQSELSQKVQSGQGQSSAQEQREQAAASQGPGSSKSESKDTDGEGKGSSKDEESEDSEEEDEDESDESDGSGDNLSKPVSGPEQSGKTDEDGKSGDPGIGASGNNPQHELDTDLPTELPTLIEEIANAVSSLEEAEAETEVKISSEVGQYEQGIFSPQVLTLPASLQATANQLSRLFEDISTDLKDKNVRNQTSGRVDLRGLAGKLNSGNDNIFYRRQDDLSRDAAMAIHLSVDVSGSMAHSDKATRAINAAYTIAKGAEMAGHKTRITAFNSEVFNVKGWHSTRVSQPTCDGDTLPLPLFTSAWADFRKIEDTEEIHNHVMVVLTDGGWGQALECQNEITKLKKNGVYTILIGLDYRPMRQIGFSGRAEYEDCYAILVVSDITQLAQVMRDTLKNLAVQISHDVVRKTW